jgi:hypothetical protein
MPETKRYYAAEIVILTLFLSGCFLFFGIVYKYHIWFIEQLQVFLLTSDHFLSYLSKPAFLSSYLGDFLTQFYWLNWGGAVVITGSLAVLWILLTLLAKRISGKKVPFILPLLPVIFTWIALCNLEYPVSNVISLVITVLFIIIYISIKSIATRRICGVIFVFLLYTATGSNVWVFTISAIIFDIFRTEERMRLTAGMIWSIILLAVTVFVPLALKNGYLLTANQSITYLSEMTKYPDIIDYMPLIAVVLMAFLAFVSREKIKVKLKSAYSLLIQILLLVSLLFSGILINADFNLEKIFRLDNEARINRWDKVLELSDKFGMHTNISSYYTNMALSKLGIMPEKLMEYYQPAATGLFIPVNANENYLTITLSNEVYWHLGDVNASQHSALLGTIFSPRAQNSRLMKRIVEINIINREYAVAEKYIRVLEKTLFHRQWASGMRKYLYNEDECKKSDWITAKRAIIPTKDLLKAGNEYVTTLRMLAGNYPDNRMAVDYLLCYHLLSKDIDSFIVDFEHYYKPDMDIILPEVYQEGLLIKIASGEKSPADYNRFRFTPEIVSHMAEYTRMFEENKGKGSSLYEKYGKTYWFYYHFATLRTAEEE